MQTLLVLAADPGEPSLRLDRELRAIRAGLERARHRHRFHLATRLAVRPKDVRRAVLDLEPAIVHFSGHGDGARGLLLEGPGDRPRWVDGGTLESFFKIFAAHVRCVVLNACDSASVAEDVARHVDHAVGMDGPLEDQAGIEYSVAFYDALGTGAAVAQAHELGRNAILWAGFAGHEAPRLFVRPGARPRPFRRRAEAGGPWTVPAVRNPFFSGREEVLAELRSRLEASGPGAAAQAVTGLGGIGKTQVVAEYCHRYRDRYPAGVLWVEAATSRSLNDGYGDLARRLGLVADEEADAGRARRAVLDWLHRHDGWLLVLDGADEPPVLAPFLPTAGGGHVVVTSRRSRLAGLGVRRPLGLEVFAAADSLAFLTERAGVEPGTEHEAAAELAEELGHLPLALEQAAAYVEVNETGWAAYLEEWRRQRMALLERQAPQAGGYHATVASTWAMSFERVAGESPAAADVLRAAAFLAPDAIPYELITDAAEHLGPELSVRAAELAGGFAAGELLAPLARYSLIRRHAADRVFSVHRLVQDVLRRELDEAAAIWLGRVVDAVDAIFPDVAFETWTECRRLFPHARRLARAVEATGLATGSADRLLNQAASFAYQQGRFAETLQLLELSVRIAGVVHGAHSEETLASRGNLAVAHRAAGNLEQARALHQAVADARLEMHGSEHPDTLTSINNLAEARWDSGDVEGARELHRQVLETRRRTLGEEHRDTLESMANLAETCRELDDLETAGALHRQVLASHRRTLGDRHPETLTARSHLAQIRLAQGAADEAAAEHAELLEERRRLLGAEHPDTLISMNRLAAAQRQLGALAEARGLRAQVLQIRRRRLGEDHPSTASSKLYLAEVLDDLGDSSAAHDLLAEALSAFRQVLGEEHPQTRDVRRRLDEVETAVR